MESTRLRRAGRAPGSGFIGMISANKEDVTSRPSDQTMLIERDEDCSNLSNPVSVDSEEYEGKSSIQSSRMLRNSPRLRGRMGSRSNLSDDSSQGSSKKVTPLRSSPRKNKNTSALQDPAKKENAEAVPNRPPLKLSEIARNGPEALTAERKPLLPNIEKNDIVDFEKKHPFINTIIELTKSLSTEKDGADIPKDLRNLVGKDCENPLEETLHLLEVADAKSVMHKALCKVLASFFTFLNSPESISPTSRSQSEAASNFSASPREIRLPKKPFKFTPPPEAPIFYPTKEEFEDPLRYIHKIGKAGLQCGIVKIVPPDGWKPPFALNYDNFKFRPRVQKINELEAHTRIKLNFMAMLTRAVAKEGKLPKLPYIEKSILDLYTLNLIVDNEGGYDNVNRNKRWGDIANEMGLTSKSAAGSLKHHYETWITPYKECLKKKSSEDPQTEPEEDFVRLTNARELRSLEFLGPGPKMPICNYNFGHGMRMRTRHKKVQYEFDPLSKYMCQACGQDDLYELMAACKKCNDKYHMMCLVPPLEEQPKEWVCAKCIVASETVNPFEEFGFDTADREFSLRQFGQMADKFKQNHFKMHGRLVTTDKVEEEYWKIMGNVESDVTVHYGADLSTMDVGSGFPTHDNLEFNGCEDKERARKYAESRWNLNNLSVLGASALKHITSNISGMKVPWAYVGMCFSTFCWHNEDHWSYSINYLHWGEPKTWYGVSGHDAAKFEKVMHSLAPELFDVQPDLLHQLVTTMNPNLLEEKGIKIYRTDQKEGEFVITFPRAYHAGFNQGFNFAEACNFAPADWIDWGRQSIHYYSSFQRNCVFSHDELICTIAENPDGVDRAIGMAAFEDMKEMLNLEKQRRNNVTKKGVSINERDDFSSAKDDNRQCAFCKTTCFLSAIYCPCSSTRLVCLDHLDKLCSCPTEGKVLKYQYTINELCEMHLNFRKALELQAFDTWLDLAKTIYETKEVEPQILRQMIDEASQKNYPLTSTVKRFMDDAELTLKYVGISRKIIESVILKKEIEKKFSLKSLNLLHEILVKGLPWTVPEAKSVIKLMKIIKSFQTRITDILAEENPEKEELISCYKVGSRFNVIIPELTELQKKLKENDWLPENVIEGEAISLEALPLPAPVVDKISQDVSKMSDLLTSAKEWNEKCEELCSNRIKSDLNEIEAHLKKGRLLKIEAAELNKLEEVHKSARDWTASCEDLLLGKKTLNLSGVNELIEVGISIPVKLALIKDLIKEYGVASDWLDKVKNMLCLPGSPDSVLQTLWPRKFKMRHEYGSQLTEEPSLALHEVPDISEPALRTAHDEEFKSLMSLRWENHEKMQAQSEQLCLCSKPIKTNYVTCELCKASFHSSCFPCDDSYNKNLASLSQKIVYCTFCIRTKRPALVIIKNLIDSADDSCIKLPEYHVMKYQYSEQIRWSRNVHAFLCNKDVNLVLNRLNPQGVKGKQPLAPAQLSNDRLLELDSLLLRISVLEASVPGIARLWKLVESTRVDTTSKCKKPVRRKRKSVETVTPRELPKRRASVQGSSLTLDSGSDQEDTPEPPPAAVPQRPKTPQPPKVVQQPKTPQPPKVLLPTQTPEPQQKQPTPTKRIRIQDMEVDEIDVSKLPAAIFQKLSGPQLVEYLNEERCAYPKCLKPTDENIHWVQCDAGCLLWFHLVCMNIPEDSIRKDKEYFCYDCMVKQANLQEDDKEMPF